MATTVPLHTECIRCGRKLTAVASVRSGFGPVCRQKLAEVAAAFKPAQIASAMHTIAVDGAVPVAGERGVWHVVSSDGSKSYRTTATTCTCKAAEKGRSCYHLVIARVRRWAA